MKKNFSNKILNGTVLQLNSDIKYVKIMNNDDAYNPGKKYQHISGAPGLAIVSKFC